MAQTAPAVIAAVGEVRRLLVEQADAKVKESNERFFKEELRAYRVKGQQAAKIAKNVRKLMGPVSKAELLVGCEELWQSGYIEESFAACERAYSLQPQYLPADLAVFERWIDNYVSNWASCDTFCNHSVGDFMLMYPDLVDELAGWTASPNRWKRRAASVSLIIPARRGYFLPQISRIAEALLPDKNDLVQKGYGWMLKAASEAHPAEVFEFVMSKRQTMPRTAFRYSLEKMPPEWRKKAMHK